VHFAPSYAAGCNTTGSGQVRLDRGGIARTGARLARTPSADCSFPRSSPSAPSGSASACYVFRALPPSTMIVAAWVGHRRSLPGE